MSLNIRSPADALERRRLQNRVAQRKFRQKRPPKSDNAASTENPPSIVSAPASAGQQGISTTDTSSTIVSDFLFSTDSFASLNDPPHQDNDSLRLEEGLFGEWGADAMDSILPNNISFSPADASNFHLNLASQDISPEITIPPHSQPIPTQTTGLPHNPLEFTQNKGWLSTIHIAAQSGNELILNILIQQNADLNEKDSNGRTPLIYAVIEDNPTIVTLLLAHGARIDEIDCDDRSALHWAVLHRREEILKILLEHKQEPGLDVDAPDFSGWTPMHMAVHVNFELGVKMLLDGGADINIKARECPHTSTETGHRQIPGLLTRRSVWPVGALSHHM